MTKHTPSRLARDYIWITLGAVIYSLSFDWFYVPNEIGFGGITALGMILNRLIPGLPIGTVVLVLNIPIFLLGSCWADTPWCPPSSLWRPPPSWWT